MNLTTIINYLIRVRDMYGDVDPDTSRGSMPVVVNPLSLDEEAALMSGWLPEDELASPSVQ